MNDFKKVVNIGKYKQYNGKYYGNVYCKIEFKNGRLSISGVESPRPNGNCLGGCGQIYDELSNIDTFNKGWDIEKLNSFVAVWKKHHLNDMRAGTAKQMEFLDIKKEELKRLIARGYKNYDAVIMLLKSYDKKMNIIPYYDVKQKLNIIEKYDKIIKKLKEKKDKIYNFKNISVFLDGGDVVATYRYLDDDIKWQTMKVKKELNNIDIKKGIEEIKDIYTHKMQKLLLKEIDKDIKDFNDMKNDMFSDTMYNFDGKKYGHAWYFEEVPQDIVEWLEALPKSEEVPAWV